MNNRRMVVLPWAIWVFLAVAAISGVAYCSAAKADPLYKADGINNNGQPVSVILYSEKCALPGVTNLPKRATWHEVGKVMEGCWGLKSKLDIVVAFFEDLMVEVMPTGAFVEIHGV